MPCRGDPRWVGRDPVSCAMARRVDLSPQRTDGPTQSARGSSFTLVSMQNVNIGAHCRIRFSRFLSLNNKYHGRTLLCRADYQGRPIPGRISFSADAVTVKLVGFEHFVHFEHGDTVLLQLEDNCYCTAIADPTSPGINQTATDLCHSVKFDVSQAIIGFRPWKEADRVQEFYFRLSDVNGVLEAPDIRRMITATKVSEHSNSKIIEACSGDATITISYRLSFGWPDDFYKVDDFHGCIRFTSAKTVEEISEYVALIRTFFTMAAGVTVSTKDYWLVPDSDYEQPMLGGGVALAPFQLLWSGGEHDLSRVPKISKPTSVLRCRSLGSNFKCNTRSPQGIGCCDGQTWQAPQQRGTWRDFRRA